MNVSTEQWCRSCGHAAHLSRVVCDCPRCSGQHLETREALDSLLDEIKAASSGETLTEFSDRILGEETL
jgi:Zn finger protein HypA/HybF involved in hydrogenase expression